MNLTERVFHSVLFEMGAVTVATIAVTTASNTATDTAIGVSIVMAIMAMALNFTFNYLFDKIFTGKREERGFSFRLFHTFAFEGTLLLFTIPTLAYMLEITLGQALFADIGLTLLITLYALIFNWIYDHIRLKFVR